MGFKDQSGDRPESGRVLRPIRRSGLLKSPVTLRPLLTEGLPFRRRLHQRTEWREWYISVGGLARGE